MRRNRWLFRLVEGLVEHTSGRPAWWRSLEMRSIHFRNVTPRCRRAPHRSNNGGGLCPSACLLPPMFSFPIWLVAACAPGGATAGPERSTGARAAQERRTSGMRAARERRASRPRADADESQRKRTSVRAIEARDRAPTRHPSRECSARRIAGLVVHLRSPNARTSSANPLRRPQSRNPRHRFPAPLPCAARNAAAPPAPAPACAAPPATARNGLETHRQRDSLNVTMCRPPGGNTSIHNRTEGALGHPAIAPIGMGPLWGFGVSVRSVIA